MSRATPLPKQGGMTLIESLIAILIFSIGILGLAGLQANAVKMSSDAKYRADAAFLANSLIGQLAVVDPTTGATFNHQITGAGCASSGTASTNATVLAWLSQVNTTLPNAASTKQQVKFNAANNVLDITLCWQAPNGSEHSHTVTTQLQWQ